ncbi:helix-turn-helix domain-containing protein, partial [Carnobacterium maltaromaticum]
LQEELKNITNKIWIEDTSNGYILYRKNNYPLHGIITEWVTDSLSFRFIHDLFLDEVKGIESFKEKNYISTTVFYKETQQIRKWLPKYGVSVEPKPKLKLYGEEHQIRYLFFKLYWEVDEGKKVLTDYRDLINAFIIKLEKITGYSFNAIQKEQLALAVGVSLIRIEKKIYIKVTEMVILDQNFHGVIIEAYKNLLSKYKLDKRTIESEIAFLFMLISTIPLKLPPNNYFMGFENAIQPACTEATNRLINVSKTYIRLDFKKMRKDIGMVRRLEEIHCEALFFIPYSKENKHSIAEKKMRILNKIFDNVINDLCEKVKSSSWLRKIYSEKNFLLKEYSQVFDHYIYWDIYIKKVNIQIYMDVSLYEELSIRKELIKKFHEKIKISQQNDPQHPDIIITNTLLKMNTFSNQTEMFFWDSNPSKQLWEKLSKLINRF